MSYKLNLSGVGYNKFATMAHYLFYVHSNYGVSLSGIGTDSQDTLCTLEIAYRVGHCSTAERCGQTGHSGGMSETGTVVDIVGTQYRPGEFLHDIVVFVSALR